MNSNIFRNVFSLAAGTASTQVISFLIIPIVTRLYEPEAYGILGSFVALLGIATQFSCGSYHLAIPLPRREKTARCLASLSFSITLVLFLITILLSTFGYLYTNLYQANVWLFFPICFFLASLSEINLQTLIRRKSFSWISVSNLIMASGVGISQIILSYLGKDSLSLLAGFLIGVSAKTLLSYRLAGIKYEISIFNTKRIIKAFADFPFFRMPQLVLSALSFGAPVLFLHYSFGPEQAGLYALARSAVGLPVNLIGAAVKDVLFVHFSELRGKHEQLSRLYLRSILFIAAISFIPFLVIFYFSDIIFGLFFGKNWTEAGVYAAYICPWLLLMTVSRPAISLLPVLRQQDWLLQFEVVSTLLKLAFLYLCLRLRLDPLYSILAFSLVGTILYLYMIMKTWLLCKNVGLRTWRR